MGKAATEAVSQAIREAVETKGEARVIFASAPSQNELIDGLVADTSIPWDKVTAFHMDEYLGIDPMDHPSFGDFLRKKLFSKVPVGMVHYINPNLDAAESTIETYTRLLNEAPVDVVCLGIGENGHLAFNDPPVADFDDPATVKVVALDEYSINQQVNDAGFASYDDVPKTALTLTIPALLACRTKVVVVPGPRKAKAVGDTLHGPVSTACPASILREAGGTLYLDTDSAANIPSN